MKIHIPLHIAAEYLVEHGANIIEVKSFAYLSLTHERVELIISVLLDLIQ
jgi:hypothetical protein